MIMMKKKIRLLAVLTAFAVIMSALSACSLKLTVDDDETAVSSQSGGDEGNESTSARNVSVSIIQYSDYSSLNECCSGITKKLDEAKIGYEVTVGSEHNEASDCEEKAQDIAINSSCDLVIAIGTPCAETVCPIIRSAGRMPVVFCAVTDPVGIGIVDSTSSPGENCTGVATAFDIDEQLNMINTFQPTITRLGVIYTESEQNTAAQLKTLKEGAEKLGITVYAEPADDPSKLSEITKELMTKVEAIVLLPDNMIAKNSWNITSQTIAGMIPLYGVNLSQVQEGALAGYCYDFSALGAKAADKAIDILHGESAADMSVSVERSGTLYVNKDRLKDLEMEIPDEYKQAANEVATSYEK